MRTLVTNIKSLVQTEETPREAVCGEAMAEVESINDAYLSLKTIKLPTSAR